MELRAVHLYLSSISSNSEGLIFQECLSELNTHFKRAETVVSEIDVFIREIITSAGRDGRRTQGPTENLKPSKLVWIRRKSKLSRLTLQVTSIVTALVATLQVLQSHQTTTVHDPQQSVVIQSIGVIQEQPQSAEVQGSSAPPEHRTGPTNCRVIDEAVINDTATLPGTGSINDLSRQSSIDSFHSFESSHNISSSSYVSLCGTLAAEPCRRFCQCQCHLSTYVRMPAWVKSILGTISFHGNRSVLLNRRPCDLPSCGRGGSETVQFSYYAPAWAFLRSFNFHLQARSTCGPNSHFSFHMPRVIPKNALVWSVIEFGRFSELRRMLRQGETSPYDVTDFGSSILYVSFKELICINCR
jgi:hypothetical protein